MIQVGTAVTAVCDMFSRRPWADPARRPSKDLPVGMLGPQETLMLQDIASTAYSGAGSIVDAGCYLGRSAVALANGLAANDGVRDRSGRIHCYDLFTAGPFGVRLLAEHGVSVEQGDSIRHLFDRNTERVSGALQVHEGNLMEARWDAGPIEVLFIDIAKTEALCGRVHQLFFQDLIPGKSIIIHQDYHHAFQSFVQVVVEFLSPYLDVLDPRTDYSHVSLLREAIPRDALRRAASFDFAPEEQMNLMRAACERLPQHSRHYVGLATASLALRLGRRDEARSELERWKRSPPPDRSPIDAYRFPGDVERLETMLAS